MITGHVTIFHFASVNLRIGGLELKVPFTFIFIKTELHEDDKSIDLQLISIDTILKIYNGITILD